MRSYQWLLVLAISLGCACSNSSTTVPDASGTTENASAVREEPPGGPNGDKTGGPDAAAPDAPDPEVVATAAYGSLHESDLAAMRRGRQQLVGFFANLQQALLRAGSTTEALQFAARGLGANDEQTMVDVWLLARHAERLGIVPGDQVIDDYLDRLTDGRIPPADVQAMLEQVGLTSERLLAVLRDELLAQKLQEIFADSLMAVTPSQRWVFFRQLRQTADVELAAIDVSAYAERVDEPDEDVLRGFFEQYKTEFPYPYSPTPGFRVPHKIAVEYFKAEEDAYVDRAAITLKEIEDFRRPFQDIHARMENPPTDEEIREELAERNARSRIEAIFGVVQDLIHAYRERLLVYEIRRESDPDAQPPTAPDLQEMALLHGLTLGRTPLFAMPETTDHEVGRSYVEFRYPFDEFVFGREMPPYRAASSRDARGNHYLFWKVDDAPQRVPEFEDDGIRDQVIHAWKMLQARELALAEAGRLADEVRKSGAALQEALAQRPNVRISRPEPFSWMIGGDALPGISTPGGTYGALPETSDVAGVDYAGEEFMQAIFSLAAGEIGVTANQPKTTVYVARLIETSPPHKVLWSTFLVAPYLSYSRSGDPMRQQAFAAWYDEIVADAGLVWQREPIGEGP